MKDVDVGVLKFPDRVLKAGQLVLTTSGIRWIPRIPKIKLTFSIKEVVLLKPLIS